MGLFTRILGTVSSYFQVGGPAGFRLKNNDGALDARDSGDSAYINVRGADPASNDDFVTKRYSDRTPGLGAPVGGTVPVFGSSTSILVGTASGATGAGQIELVNLGPGIVTLGTASFAPSATDGFPIPPAMGPSIWPWYSTDITQFRVYVPAGTTCKILVHLGAVLSAVVMDYPLGGVVNVFGVATTMLAGTALGATGSGAVRIINAGTTDVTMSAAASPPTLTSGFVLGMGDDYDWQAADVTLTQVYVTAGNTVFCGVHQ